MDELQQDRQAGASVDREQAELEKGSHSRSHSFPSSDVSARGEEDKTGEQQVATNGDVLKEETSSNLYARENE